jgi:hypothetical protein
MHLADKRGDFMRHVLVLAVALLVCSVGVLGHSAGWSCSCEKKCRSSQHEKQDDCKEEFNDAVQECREDYACGTCKYRKCVQHAYDEKQVCMDKTDVWYDNCADKCEA